MRKWLGRERFCEGELGRGDDGGTTMPSCQKASAVVMSCKKGVVAHAHVMHRDDRWVMGGSGE